MSFFLFFYNASISSKVYLIESLSHKTVAFYKSLWYTCKAVVEIQRLMRSETANNKSEVKIMREGIHPTYYQAKVVCNCGNEFVTGSTKSDIHVEVCSKCHSFYTGQQKTAAARGRIDKFNRKYGINAN